MTVSVERRSLQQSYGSGPCQMPELIVCFAIEWRHRACSMHSLQSHFAKGGVQFFDLAASDAEAVTEADA